MPTLYDAEGFDDVSATLVTTKGWASNPYSMQTGLLGRGQCARVTNQGYLGRKTLVGGAHATLVGGFRFRANQFESASQHDIYTLFAGATSAARVHIDGSNHISVLNSGGTVIATGTSALSVNVVNYIELKIVINGASGSCEVHLNGNSASPEIATTTGNFGTVNLDGCGGSTLQSSGSSWDYDDMYWASDFLGDTEVETQFPTSDGANTDLTPLGGGSHCSKVNEATGTFPDGDTTYNSANSAVKDTYGMGALAVSAGTVYGVVINAYARKDDSGSRTLDQVIRQAGSDHALGSPSYLSSTYAMVRWVNLLDPVGGAWTISNVNADEFGVLVG